MATPSKATNSPSKPAESVRIDATPDGAAFTVKVVPGASRSAVLGIWGDALRVSVVAPPEAGKANTAVRKLLAEALRVKRGAVRILSGHGRPLKRIAVDGLTVADAQAAVAAALP